MSKLLSNYHLLNRFFATKTLQTIDCVKHLSRFQLSTDVPKSGPNGDNVNDYDIVINGGGIVGFSALLALKRSPFLKEKRICLFERQMKSDIKTLDRSDNHFSNRVSSITKASKKFFKQIDVWNELKDFAKPIKELYVWSKSYRNAINFMSNVNDFDQDFDPEDSDYVCYVIENNRILSSIESKLNQIDGSICYETVVTDITSGDNCLRIDTKCLKNETSNSFKTKLLIGSDGFDSIVRQKSNLVNFEHDLQQMGIVGTIAVSSGDGNPHNDIAFQKFVSNDNSVIALLPLTQEFSSFVWSVPKELAKRLMQLSDEEFVDHMNDTLFNESKQSSESMVERFDDILSSLLPKTLIDDQTPRYSMPYVSSLIADSRAVFPFKFSTTLPYSVGATKDNINNNKIVLIGDAAHRVHPLAGQGLNLGIGDAQVLTQCLHDSLYRGEDLFGDCKQLENCLFDFERRRQLKSIAMICAIHSMQELFTCVPKHLLSVFNSSQFFKRKIVSFANSH